MRLLRTLLPAAACLAVGCARHEPASEARLAQALDAIQHGRPDEAARALAAIRPAGGWLRPATYTAPLALRLRAQIAVRTAAVDEVRRLLGEYARRYEDLAPAAYVRDRIAFLERFRDWQGVPALLYLRGEEAADENPGLAIREWRTLLRDYPHSALAAATHLKLGLLQTRLENTSWALADLAEAAGAPTTAVDPAGNPVAPQALLALGRVHRDLQQDRPAARRAFAQVVETWAKTLLKSPDGEVSCSPAVLARFEQAVTDPDDAPALLQELMTAAEPQGLVTAARIGHARLEARLKLAELALGRRGWEAARALLVEVARQGAQIPVGIPGGPRRTYGYEAADWLEAQLGSRAPEAALSGLTEAAAAARTRELWAYIALKRVRLFSRLGRPREAREAVLELEKRAPNLEVDADGTGLLIVPAREARRVAGA